MSEDSEAEPFIPRSDTFDLAETAGARKSARKGIIPCFGMIVFAIVGVVFFGAGVGVGYLVWSHTSSPSQGSVCSQQTLKDEICANPPVLQISIDGYWAGYYPRDLNPNLRSLAENGVRAEYMRSQYPTKTFPNHFSIVTGLFPESHGIVDNTFIDKHLKETFKLSNRDQTDSKWWLGEPVWITAQKQDLISGVYFWPGSETDFNGSRPHFYFEYTDKAPYQLRVDTVLSWFDLQNTSRPQYMAMYFNEPDHTGHSYGPNSPEVNAAIANVDYYLGLLIRGLKQRGIFDCVNIIITSDHGMASTPANQTIPFDTSLPKGASALIRGTSVSLTVDSPADKEEVYRMFKYPNGSTFHPKVEVYYQWEVPVRFHVGHSLKWRYGDILMIPKVGWILGHHSISATHGYDNNAEEMQAIFFAHGPAFQKGIVVPAFDNIEVYNLVCALLGIKPSDNNGTFGSLYHMLKEDLIGRLPPAETHKPLPEKNVICPLPDSTQQINNLANITCVDFNCSIDSQARLQAVATLKLTSDDMSTIQQKILPWGIPIGGGGEMGSCLLTNNYFITKYSNELHIPLWSAYVMEGNSLAQNKESVRNKCFTHDPRVLLEHSSSCSDYAGPFLRGQLVPPDHLPDSSVPRELSFLLSNAVPQYKEYKQGIGLYLENKIHSWAESHSKIYVISGVVLDADNDGHRDKDSLYSQWTNGSGSAAVPSHFFTIITFCNHKSIASIAECPVDDLNVVVLMTINTNSIIPEGYEDNYLKERLTTIRELETITGIDFFPNLSVSDQNRMELRIVLTLDFN